MNVRQILEEIGIKINYENETHAQFCPSYRGSDNKKAASINLQTGHVRDFVTGEDFGLLELVEKVTGEKVSKEEINKYKSISKVTNFEPEEKDKKFWTEDCLIHFLPDHSYWINRGISKETLDFFKGGVSHGGKLYQRYVWPCYDRYNRIIGFTGRDLTGKSDIKYKHEGNSKEFLFGLFNKDINGERPILKSIIEQRHVILVEGPSDSVSCFDEGLKNVLPTMGLNISVSMISFLLGINPKKITLAYNKDTSYRGQNAAVTNFVKLAEHFDLKKLEIKYPFGNDMAEEKSKIKKFLDKPSENILGEFKNKYLRSLKGETKIINNKMKMSKKEVIFAKKFKKELDGC